MIYTIIILYLVVVVGLFIFFTYEEMCDKIWLTALYSAAAGILVTALIVSCAMKAFNIVIVL
jgi:hypothetical protein